MKAVFMDYYGTVAHENGPIAMEVVQSIYKSSQANSPEDVFRYWWKIFREKLAGANGADFRTQHDVALDSFIVLLKHFESSENPERLLARMEEHWRTVPLYDDARLFLEKVCLPIYFVTNSDDSYVSASLAKHDLHPAGVITSEQAKYSKPRKEIFLYALEKANLNLEDVLHIGDSLESDVRCPGQVGIKSIWLNRRAEPVPDGVVSVEGLIAALEILQAEM